MWAGTAVDVGVLGGALPSAWDDPSAMWLFEVVGPLVWLGVLVYFVRESVRARTLTFGLLLVVSMTTMSWQEFYGDWAAYLLYSPKFELIDWGSTTWTTPNKPWAVVPAYGWYFAAVFPAMLWLIGRVRDRWPSLGPVTALLIVTVPIFYVWDLVVEGGASAMGWWTYVDHVGPAVTSDRGVFPLVFPLALFVTYGVVATWVLSPADDRKVRFEAWFRLERIGSGWRREVTRVGAWIVAMNAVYWIVLIFPLVLIREWFGDPSVLVP